jgi:KAP family P-loop domain
VITKKKGKFGTFITFLRKYIKGVPVNIEYRYPEIINIKTTKILTDEVNFNPVSPDNKFDFEEYSNAVVSIIHGSEPQFSVGIYGEWGSGKTTLMEMIRRKLTPEKFRWEDIPNDQSKCDLLRQYLKANFKIDWIDKQTFNKSDNTKMIYLSDTHNTHNQKQLSIDLNPQTTNATLKIDYRPVYEFLVRKTNSGLAICENNILTVWFNAWRYENEKEFALIPLMKTIAYAIGDHPIYKDIKPLILRALAILGKDALRFYALKYFMTEKGIEKFETNLKNKFEDSEEFDRDALYLKE